MRQRGFTLMELLLVMVIISIMVGLVAVSLGDSPSQQLKREGRRLQMLLTAASDEAMQQGIDLGWGYSEGQYQVLWFNPEKLSWEVPPVELANSYTLDEAIELELKLQDSLLDENALTQSERLRQLQNDTPVEPSVLVLSSGELTPFQITLRHRDIENEIIVSSDGISGVFVVEQP